MEPRASATAHLAELLQMHGFPHGANGETARLVGPIKQLVLGNTPDTAHRAMAGKGFSHTNGCGSVALRALETKHPES